MEQDILSDVNNPSKKIKYLSKCFLNTTYIVLCIIVSNISVHYIMLSRTNLATFLFSNHELVKIHLIEKIYLQHKIKYQ